MGAMRCYWTTPASRTPKCVNISLTYKDNAIEPPVNGNPRVTTHPELDAGRAQRGVASERQLRGLPLRARLIHTFEPGVDLGHGVGQ